MSRIGLVVLAGIGICVPGPSFGQNSGVPKGSRCAPFSMDRIVQEEREAAEHGSANSDSKSKKRRKKASVNRKSPQRAPATKPTRPEGAAVRTWTDDAGKPLVEGSFVRLEGDRLTLQKTDGKKVPFALARLSKNDQQFAKTESRISEIKDEYDKKIAQLQAKRKKLFAAEKKRLLDAKKPQSETDAERGRKFADEVSSVSTEVTKLMEERIQKTRELYNEYSIAIGMEPLYVDDGRGKLESRELLASRKQPDEETAKVSRTPRLAADSYVKTLLQDGTLRDANYLDERAVTAGPQRDAVDRALGRASGVGGGSRSGTVAGPPAYRAVYYRVTYVSQAGLVIEKDAYVLTYYKGALWEVEGLHLDE